MCKHVRQWKRIVDEPMSNQAESQPTQRSGWDWWTTDSRSGQRSERTGLTLHAKRRTVCLSRGPCVCLISHIYTSNKYLLIFQWQLYDVGFRFRYENPTTDSRNNMSHEAYQESDMSGNPTEQAPKEKVPTWTWSRNDHNVRQTDWNAARALNNRNEKKKDQGILTIRKLALQLCDSIPETCGFI